MLLWRSHRMQSFSQFLASVNYGVKRRAFLKLRNGVLRREQFDQSCARLLWVWRQRDEHAKLIDRCLHKSCMSVADWGSRWNTVNDRGDVHVQGRKSLRCQIQQILSKSTMAMHFAPWTRLLLVHKQFREKSTRRWTAQTQVATLRTWREHVQQKQQLKTASKVVGSRLARRSEAFAWSAWQQLATQACTLQVARLKVAIRWTRKLCARALSKWWAALRRSRQARRIVVRWTRKTIGITCIRWQTHVHSERRLRLISCKLCTKWQQQITVRGWARWLQQHLQIACVVKLKERILRRWILSGLAWGIEAWKEQAKLRRRLARAAGKVICRWQRMLVAPSWARWAEQNKEAKRRRRSGRAVMKQWQHLCLVPVVGVLRERAALRKSIRQTGTKVLLRWQRLGKMKGFVGWRQQTEQQRHFALLSDKIVRQWTKMATRTAWNRWRQHAQRELRHRNQRDVLERIADRIKSICTYKALAAWSHNVNELARQRGVLERMVLRMRNALMYRG